MEKKIMLSEQLPAGKILASWIASVYNEKQ